MSSQNHSRLITCDLVCAGVPSPGLWRSFVSWIEGKTGKRIAGFEFRPKRNGVPLAHESLLLSDGSRHEGDVLGKTWRNLFGSGLAFRPACHACAYATLARTGDFTLGDFWGIERAKEGIDDGHGISLVLASSSASAHPFPSGRAVRLPAQSAVTEGQPALSHPHRANAARLVFWRRYASGGFAEAASFAGVGTILATLRRKVASRLGVFRSPGSAVGRPLFDVSFYATGREGYPICEDPLKCTGCSACMASCPKGAITMVPNTEGFLVPRIDPADCISCGKCRKVCPANGAVAEVLKSSPVCAYAYRNTDDVRAHSSSGGAFWALAKPVIDAGGVVYGAAFDELFNVRHIRCEDETALKRCCGSKYVQSDVGEMFAAVREDLASGRRVLFSGTPCQVAGLKSYLKLCGGGWLS